MIIDDFDFDLPEQLIAQVPLEDRSSSKLMIIDKDSQEITHTVFSAIIDQLHAGDVLVVNESKVIPARLFGLKEETNAAIECLLLKQDNQDIWETLIKPGKRVKIGTKINFGEGLLIATCIGRKEDGIFLLSFAYAGIFFELLEQLGIMPLPPYIHQQLEQKQRYQTVYAKDPGSVAAPTAGLHFTNELLEQISAKGVIIEAVTLHVGLGTFRPVSVDNIDEHIMHSEYYEMSAKTAAVLTKAKTEKRRIIAVGTTTTRVLESVWQKNQGFLCCDGWTDIFISPGYQWNTIDGLITNFHLPKSTLLMLVSSFSSRKLMLAAYLMAIDNSYRFFSFGDAMFIKSEKKM
ncbi:MAG: tRNA preQ1(34) S-adenosylmethionine ribosyltransferase-isomerase QueA [Culicoidibacterales bacterium]